MGIQESLQQAYNGRSLGEIFEDANLEAIFEICCECIQENVQSERCLLFLLDDKIEKNFPEAYPFYMIHPKLQTYDPFHFPLHEISKTIAWGAKNCPSIATFIQNIHDHPQYKGSTIARHYPLLSILCQSIGKIQEYHIIVYLDHSQRKFEKANKAKLEPLAKELQALFQQYGNSIAEQLTQMEQLDEILGTSPSMRKLKRDILLCIRFKTPIFLDGETGVGKTYIAKIIHEFSPLTGQFQTYNCANLQNEAGRMQLYGNLAVGNAKAQIGIIEQANNGTLFLDEIAEIPLPEQATLLTAIEKKEFYPINGARPIFSDFRLICASNKNLSEHFREDLYYRICRSHIKIPALREHAEDIPYLIDRIQTSVQEENNLRRDTRFSADIKQYFQRQSWPGNIRQLRTVVENALVQIGGKEINSSHQQQLDRIIQHSSPSIKNISISTTPEQYFSEHAQENKAIPDLTIEEYKVFLVYKYYAQFKRKKIDEPTMITKIGLARATIYKFVNELDNHSTILQKLRTLREKGKLDFEDVP